MDGLMESAASGKRWLRFRQEFLFARIELFSRPD